MKTYHAAALLLAGIAIGAIGAESLRAQTKPPVYMIANNEILDHDGYAKEYLPTAQATIRDHGGRYVAAGKGVLIDGDPPKGRVVILRWDNMDQLLGWRHSPEYERIRQVGEKYAKYNVIAVEGIPQ